MRKLLLLLMVLWNGVFAQQKSYWHLTVTDSVTDKGITGATITINRSTFFKTGVRGKIDIDKRFIESTDSLTISCVGYNTLKIKPGAGHQFPAIVKLTAHITDLKEVKIGSSHAEIRVGDIQKKYKVHRITVPATGFAQFIPDDKQLKGIITSATVDVNDELHGIEMPFRLRLYTKNKNSLALDRELTKDSLIILNPERRKRITVDLSKYNIRFPDDGIIVIFETLPRAYYPKDSVLYLGNKYIRTPGIDMDLKKNNWQTDNDKINRTTPYSMVGPEADRWNWGGAFNQWYVYLDGNNFAITLTVRPNE